MKKRKIMNFDDPSLEWLLVPLSEDLYPKIEAKAEEWELTIQETIIRILRENFEQEKK